MNRLIRHGLQFCCVTVFALGWGTVAEGHEKAFDSYSGTSGLKKDQEKACECCMECMAATKPVKSKHNGVPAENGCKDCCEECGDRELPLEPEAPPERK